MHDYVIISRCLRTSLLDVRVFCGTQLDTDHELIVSTFRFKIKCKRHWNTWQPRKEATILNSTQHHSFIMNMKEALARSKTGTMKTTLWKHHASPSKMPLWKRKRRVRHGCACAMLKQTIPFFLSYSGSIISCAAEPTEQLRRRGTTGGALRQQKQRNAREWQNRMAMEDL